MELKNLLALKKDGKNITEELMKLFENSEDFDAYGGLEVGAVYDEAISNDSDLEYLLELLNIRTADYLEDNVLDFDKKFSKYGDFNIYLCLFDGSTMVVVPGISKENRFDSELSNEDFFFFNLLEELFAGEYLVCDKCERFFFRDNLINLDPVNEESNEMKKDYVGFDGMVCEKCYNEMSN